MVRVLCITLNPSGGALNPALRRLGFNVYDMKSVFKSRSAPLAWAKITRGTEHYNPALLEKHDAAVGIPTSSCWERIYHAAPPYMKVILVVEEDKIAWANNVIHNGLPVLREIEKVGGRSKIGKEWTSFFSNMYPREIVNPSSASTSFSKFVAQREAEAAARAKNASTPASLANSNLSGDSSSKDGSTGGSDATTTAASSSSASVLGGSTSRLGMTRMSQEVAKGSANVVPPSPPRSEESKPSEEDELKFKNGAAPNAEENERMATAVDEYTSHVSNTASEWAQGEKVKLRTEEDEMAEIMAEGLADFECNVQDVVDPRRLLVYKRSEGWEPLCEFLEVPVPTSADPRTDEDVVDPFPPHDDGKAMLEGFGVRLKRAGWISQATVYLLGAFILYQLLPTLMGRGMAVPGQLEELRRDWQQAYGTMPKPLKSRSPSTLD